MIEKLEKAIEALAQSSAKADQPLAAMQFAQAACSMANALLTAKEAKLVPD